MPKYVDTIARIRRITFHYCDDCGGLKPFHCICGSYCPRCLADVYKNITGTIVCKDCHRVLSERLLTFERYLNFSKCKDL